MKSWFLLLALPVLAVSGCATLDRTEIAQLRARGVPPALLDKMARDRPLTPAEVVILTRHGVPPATLVTYIHGAGVNYVLAPADARRLRQAGVSPYVIDALAEESGYFAGEYTRPPGRVNWGVSYGDPYGWGGEPYGYGPNGAYWW